jgi:hypothetical protein
MKVVNLHKRVINEPISKVGALLNTLATKNDMMLDTDKWSPMKLDKGLQIGSKGGHGPIKYFVTDYRPERSITFQFDRAGFNGFHKFELNAVDIDKTELLHIINVETTGLATLKWLIVIRWLHDAYIEDAFDKVENYFSTDAKISDWSVWVKILRKLLIRKRGNIQRTSNF